MMLVRCSAAGLLLFTLACNPDSAPAVPVFDPLDGITELVVEAPVAMVRVGSFVDVRVLNGSDNGVRAAHSCWQLEVERQDADTWTVLPNGIFGCEARAPMHLPAGQIYEQTLRLPEEGAPGLYRITFPHYVDGTDELVVTASNTFRVESTGVVDQGP